MSIQIVVQAYLPSVRCDVGVAIDRSGFSLRCLVIIDLFGNSLERQI